MLFGSFAEANHNNTGTKDGADLGVAVVPIGYSSKILSSIVQYCCTDNVELLNSTACNAALTVDIISLADAANYFTLPILKQRAEELACKWMQEKPSLACGFLSDARACNSVETMEKIAWETIQCMPSQSLLEEDTILAKVSQPMLEEIMKNKAIDADEITMFRILKGWAEKGDENLNQDEDQELKKKKSDLLPMDRKRAASEMSKHLALDLISPSDLCDIVEPSELVTSSQLHHAYKLQALQMEKQCAGLYKRRRGFGLPGVWVSSGSDTLTCSTKERRYEAIQLRPGSHMTSGKWQWSIKIKGNCRDDSIGVISTAHSIDTNQELSKQEGGWTYWHHGAALSACGSDSATYEAGHPEFTGDSIVTLTLDICEDGTLEACVDEGEHFMLFSSMLSSFSDDQVVGFLPAVSLGISSSASVQFLGYRQLA